MDEINDGGPAFPHKPGKQLLSHVNGATGEEHWYTVPGDVPGMSLRDYFAAKAMASLITSGSVSGCADIAYQVADAMLSARKQSAAIGQEKEA